MRPQLNKEKVSLLQLGNSIFYLYDQYLLRQNVPIGRGNSFNLSYVVIIKWDKIVAVFVESWP